MIRRVSKQSDLVIQLDMDLTNIETLEIVYYTDSEYSYSITKDDIDITNDGQFVYIPSQELELMNDGILKSDIKYHLNNIYYPDGSYDNVIKQDLGVWIQ